MLFFQYKLTQCWSFWPRTAPVSNILPVSKNSFALSNFAPCCISCRFSYKSTSSESFKQADSQLCPTLSPSQLHHYYWRFHDFYLLLYCEHSPTACREPLWKKLLSSRSFKIEITLPVLKDRLRWNPLIFSWHPNNRFFLLIYKSWESFKIFLRNVYDKYFQNVLYSILYI